MLKLSRVTAAVADVLEVLDNASGEPIWGLRVINATGRPAGSVYPILARLEAAGWVESEWDDDRDRPGPRRRMYLLTEEGRPVASELVRSFRARRVAVRAAGVAWSVS